MFFEDGEITYEERDIFEELDGVISDGEPVGPSVRQTLANLSSILIHICI